MPRMMQPQLEEWLSSLSASERRVYLELATELDGLSPRLEGLLESIAFEILADMSHEQVVLKRLEDDRRAEIEEIASRAVWPKGTPTWAEVSGPPAPAPADPAADDTEVADGDV